VQLCSTTVVSSFNVSTLPEFFTYILESKLFNINNFYPSLYSLINPDFYSFSILNNELKSNIINKLSKAKFSPAVNKRIQDVILSLKQSTYDEQLLQEFKKITFEYDTLRNRNFLETFPELNSMFTSN